MPKNSEIIQKIKGAFDSLNIEEFHDSSEADERGWTKAWTKAINTTLCKIGRGFGYKVYASRVDKVDRDGGEWLYDVTWLKYEKSGRGELIAAPMVAECEWDQSDIENDFEKLLLACAGVRVMIVDGGRDPDFPERIASLLTGKVKKFKSCCTDGAWLLAVVEQFRDYSWKFKYFTFKHNRFKVYAD